MFHAHPRHVSEYLKVQQRDPKAHKFLGQLYEREGDIDKAVGCYKVDKTCYWKIQCKISLSSWKNEWYHVPVDGFSMCFKKITKICCLVSFIKKPNLMDLIYCL